MVRDKLSSLLWLAVCDDEEKSFIASKSDLSSKLFGLENNGH
jgi:hypothetical protein